MLVIRVMRHGPRKVTRFPVWSVPDEKDPLHYSLAATELRLAGLLPPSAQRAAKHP
jgi:hypothetical protein